MGQAARRPRGKSNGGGAPHSQCAFSMIDGGESFLVVRLTALGDILHTLPAVAALRAAHKNVRIDWVVERKWMPVLEGSPVINEVIPFNRASGFDALKSTLRLRQKNYTCAIDFQGL